MTSAPQLPRINLIFARAANGVIGHHNVMPWHLPQDLAHFKQLTHGCPVIMGRKTWDSLPPRFRPLPGRTNIVVTRQEKWHEAGSTPALGLSDALSLCKHDADVWIIGGAQIYTQTLPLAQRVEVTEIAQDFDGDAYAPELGPEWHETSRSAQISAGGLAFSFVRYDRLAG